jgi:hypothetical protein
LVLIGISTVDKNLSQTSLKMEDHSGLFQAREERISFSDHEAVTASLVLLKSIFS